MGTTWSLRFDNPAMLSLEAVRACVETALTCVVDQMSTWEAGSDISRFNAAPGSSRHTLPTAFADVLATALDWAAASGGAIDPTVGPLVALWGFGAQAGAHQAPPSAAELDAARSRVGWQRITLDRVQRTLVQPGGIALDLSGIAKGFAVDHVADALQALGLQHMLVEVGGELRAIGHRPDGQAWQVQVEAGPATIPRLPLDDLAIATSGDRWHTRAHGDRRWSHTIDPRSGEPAAHALAAVTVLHPRCVHADALATALTVLGPDDGLAFAQRHGVAARFVVRDGAGHHLRVSDAWAAAVPA